MFQLDHLQLVMILSLVNKAEDKASGILRWRKHTSFVCEPEELNCSLQVASKLVKYVIVRVDLLILINTRCDLEKCGS